MLSIRYLVRDESVRAQPANSHYTRAAMTTAVAAMTGAPTAGRRFSTSRHLALASFWFGSSFVWLPTGLVLTIPPLPYRDPDNGQVYA